MTMEVSVATLDDVPQLCELLELLFSQEAEFRADHAVQSVGLRQIIEQPECGQILVARDGSLLVGMVTLLTCRIIPLLTCRIIPMLPGRFSSRKASASVFELCLTTR